MSELPAQQPPAIKQLCLPVKKPFSTWHILWLNWSNPCLCPHRACVVLSNVLIKNFWILPLIILENWLKLLTREWASSLCKCQGWGGLWSSPLHRPWVWLYSSSSQDSSQNIAKAHETRGLLLLLSRCQWNKSYRKVIILSRYLIDC